jgi:hypothetical protein
LGGDFEEAMSAVVCSRVRVFVLFGDIVDGVLSKFEEDIVSSSVRGLHENSSNTSALRYGNSAGSSLPL